jgi:hypothetical protein
VCILKVLYRHISLCVNFLNTICYQFLILTHPISLCWTSPTVYAFSNECTCVFKYIFSRLLYYLTLLCVYHAQIIIILQIIIIIQMYTYCYKTNNTARITVHRIKKLFLYHIQKWRFIFPEIWHHVSCWTASDISEEIAVSIFRVVQDEDISICVSVHVASYPRRHESSLILQ